MVTTSRSEVGQVADTKLPVVASVEDLPPGAAITSSGRVSEAREEVHLPHDLPFGKRERLLLDNALTEAIRLTGIRFNIYIGDLGESPAEGADAVFPHTPDADQSVLLAVSPNQRAIEVRSGKSVANRANDRVLQLGVTAASSSFKGGDLLDGLTSAVRVMAAAIGR